MDSIDKIHIKSAVWAVLILLSWMVLTPPIDRTVYIKEPDCQELMRESWAEGYQQGYSDACFKITGDECFK